MLYKNCSYTAKTFYGVKFEPGDIKEVNRIINDRFMVIVNKAKPSTQSVLTDTKQKTSSDKSNDKVPEAVPAVANVKEEVPKQETTDDKTDNKQSKGKKSDGNQ